MTKPPEVFNAEKFERKLEKNEQQKLIDLKNSKESYYITFMLKIVLGFSCVGALGFFFYPFFIFTPIYRNDSCLGIHYGNTGGLFSWENENKILYKGYLTAQSTFFIFINWLEIVGMFMVFYRLRKIEMNKLNIKTEIKLATQIWTLFSVFYFVCN